MSQSFSRPPRALVGALALALLAGGASAATLKVSVTNTQAADGLYLTPLVAAFHDGTFTTFTEGAVASTGVREIAEEGNPAPFIAENPGRKIAVITSPGGFAGAPVIDPGETATLRIAVDKTTERFFSFLSMVIPSNDNFIGNADATAYALFDLAGAFTNLGRINVYGGDVWDSGTEVNNNIGAAFNTAGGVDTDEGGVVSLQASLAGLLGQATPDGTIIGSVPASDALLATIEISAVPLPAAFPMFLVGIGALGLIGRRRTKAA